MHYEEIYSMSSRICKELFAPVLFCNTFVNKLLSSMKVIHYGVMKEKVSWLIMNKCKLCSFRSSSWKLKSVEES